MVEPISAALSASKFINTHRVLKKVDKSLQKIGAKLDEMDAKIEDLQFNIKFTHFVNAESYQNKALLYRSHEQNYIKYLELALQEWTTFKSSLTVQQELLATDWYVYAVACRYEIECLKLLNYDKEVSQMKKIGEYAIEQTKQVLSVELNELLIDSKIKLKPKHQLDDMAFMVSGAMTNPYILAVGAIIPGVLAVSGMAKITKKITKSQIEKVKKEFQLKEDGIQDAIKNIEELEQEFAML
ncbi:hypothetical protein ORD22_06785 [Sporosarcina sp. GW1-11]|uniref:hypothetical protein n=1 Tax=Sporosarcina sp. GW1-11 TaxID=2899126 RepID=UPI00294BBEF5|nr:hypothetical protein [Sporosarcina sp. GW1-11]MDV6377968.1 hypothetical protein [Sporosarcina sp. GW1-11]